MGLRARMFARLLGNNLWAFVGAAAAGTCLALAVGLFRGAIVSLEGSFLPFRANAALSAVLGALAGFYAVAAVLALRTKTREVGELRARLGLMQQQLAESESQNRRQRARIDELSTLREVASVVNMESDFGIIVEKVLLLIDALMQPAESTIFLVGEKSGSLEPFAQYSDHNLLSGKKTLTRSIPDFQLSAFESQSVICRVHGQELHAIIPLKVEDEVKGALFMVFATDERPDYVQAREFNRNHRLLLQETVHHISLALKTKHLHTKAVMDWLTKLYSKSHFAAQLEAQVDMASRDSTKFSLVLLDIDHFKRVNDRYGHASGDRILSGVAAVVLRSLRKYDSAYRYGGEEIAVLLPNTKLEQATKIAERVRTRIQERVFTADNRERLHITVSLGVAQFNEGDDSHSLFGRADKHLYRAKRGGRNRVVPQSA